MRKIIVRMIFIALMLGSWLYSQEAGKTPPPGKQGQAAPEPNAQIEELIKQLGETQAKIEEITGALMKIGNPTKPLIQKALESVQNPEVKKRLEMILESFAWPLVSKSPLGPRTAHTAIWTGKEMIIWGGAHENKNLADGARYNPATDSWVVLSQSPLEARINHIAIWTGEEMIIWGGWNLTDKKPLANGARYNPQTDKWQMFTKSPLDARHRHTAIWTGREMIIWGGVEIRNNKSYYDPSGAAFNPKINDWHSLPKSPIEGRVGHAAVWNGKKMIIWGGGSGEPPAFSYYSDGAMYDPADRAWQLLSKSPFMPAPKEPSTKIELLQSAVWTGERMLLWGGKATLDNRDSDTARYNPVSDRWELSGPSPLGQCGKAIWTGKEMVVCADGTTSSPFRVARYDAGIDGPSYLADPWRVQEVTPLSGLVKK